MPLGPFFPLTGTTPDPAPALKFWPGLSAADDTVGRVLATVPPGSSRELIEAAEIVNKSLLDARATLITNNRQLVLNSYKYVGVVVGRVIAKGAIIITAGEFAAMGLNGIANGIDNLNNFSPPLPRPETQPDGTVVIVQPLPDPNLNNVFINNQLNILPSPRRPRPVIQPVLPPFLVNDQLNARDFNELPKKNDKFESARGSNPSGPSH